METLLEHRLEPEVAAPPPRRARLPVRMTLLLLLASLLLGLFVLGSGRALWEAGKLLWLGHAGRTVLGQVVEIQTEPAPNQGKRSLPIAIRYAVDVPKQDGTTLYRAGWIGLGRGRNGMPQAMSSYRLHQTLPVRYAPWFGGIASQVWQPSPRGRIVSLTLSGSVVLLVSLLLLGRLTRWSRDRLRLLRNGIATTGTITHKRTEAEDMVHYYLRYGYATLNGKGREREERVSPEQWKRFEVGQPVTVLFDPEKPQQVGLYALMRS